MRYSSNTVFVTSQAKPSKEDAISTVCKDTQNLHLMAHLGKQAAA